MKTWVSDLPVSVVDFVVRFRNRYRPELHYMRGYGPKSAEKQRAQDESHTPGEQPERA